MPRWTKKAAIARINSNQRLAEIFQIAPPIKRLFNRLIRLHTTIPYWRRFTIYEWAEGILAPLVGDDAHDTALRTEEAYEEVYDALADLLNLY